MLNFVNFYCGNPPWIQIIRLCNRLFENFKYLINQGASTLPENDPRMFLFGLELPKNHVNKSKQIFLLVFLAPFFKNLFPFLDPLDQWWSRSTYSESEALKVSFWDSVLQCTCSAFSHFHCVGFDKYIKKEREGKKRILLCSDVPFTIK